MFKLLLLRGVVLVWWVFFFEYGVKHLFPITWYICVINCRVFIFNWKQLNKSVGAVSVRDYVFLNGMNILFSGCFSFCIAFWIVEHKQLCLFHIVTVFLCVIVINWKVWVLLLYLWESVGVVSVLVFVYHYVSTC